MLLSDIGPQIARNPGRNCQEPLRTNSLDKPGNLPMFSSLDLLFLSHLFLSLGHELVVLKCGSLSVYRQHDFGY